jgi:hypothetical protein
VVCGESDEEVSLEYVLERACLPAGHGLLHFNRASATWASPHPDPLIQKKAECFLESYFERASRRVTA